MSFYISYICFFNRAPFNFCELSFNKHINVLTGVNGTGKTTILSHIMDLLYELAKFGYQSSFENIEDKYYRISSTSFSIDSTKSSYVYIRFNLNHQDYDYIDCISQNLLDVEFSKISLSNELIDLKDINDDLKNNSGYCKYFSFNKGLNKFESKEISKNVFFL